MGAQQIKLSSNPLQKATTDQIASQNSGCTMERCAVHFSSSICQLVTSACRSAVSLRPNSGWKLPPPELRFLDDFFGTMSPMSAKLYPSSFLPPPPDLEGRTLDRNFGQSSRRRFIRVSNSRSNSVGLQQYSSSCLSSWAVMEKRTTRQEMACFPIARLLQREAMKELREDWSFSSCSTTSEESESSKNSMQS